MKLNKMVVVVVGSGGDATAVVLYGDRVGERCYVLVSWQ